MSTFYVFFWLLSVSLGTPTFGPDTPPPATIEVVRPGGQGGGSRAVVPQAPSKRGHVGEKFFRRY